MTRETQQQTAKVWLVKTWRHNEEKRRAGTPPGRLKELLKGSVRAQFAATQKGTELTHIKLGSKSLSARMAGGEMSISPSDVFAVCLRLLLIQ